MRTNPIPLSEEMSAKYAHPDPTCVERSTDFWYPDGSIVLIAERTAFKVYQGILAQNSAVLREMFKLTQPDAMEIMDGCPVVRLSDDAMDLTYLLRSIFGGAK